MTVSDSLIGETIDNGRFQIIKHLRGQAAVRLYLACNVENPKEHYLASATPLKGNPIEKLREQLGYRVPGVLELALISAFDVQGEDEDLRITQQYFTAMLERIPDGTWLPELMAEPLPLADVLDLAHSAGETMMRASEQGVFLTNARPELMWASREQRKVTATGITSRPEEFFRHRLPSSVHLAFERHYYAPELLHEPSPSSQALAFTLALMVAHWTSGEFPTSARGIYTLSEELPPRLGEALRRCLARDPSTRLMLKELIRELERSC